MKRIVVGTLNRAKLNAVKKAVELLYPNEYQIVGLSVESSVSNQPKSDSETLLGAKNRAIAALESDPDAAFGIGIEGGVSLLDSLWFESGWIVVLDRHGQMGYGSSGRYQLSDKIMSRLHNGQELADVMDDLSGQSDVRSSQGAMGLFTRGFVPRDDACTLY